MRMKLRSKILSLLFLMFLSTCNSVPKGFELVNKEASKGRGGDCDKLLRKLAKKWSVHKENGCYCADPQLLEEIIDNKCLRDYNEEEIIEIFGTPTSRELISVWYYAISKECKSNRLRDWEYTFYIHFTEEQLKPKKSLGGVLKKVYILNNG